MSIIFGAIFPISSENIRALFDQKKNAFVKFTKFSRLKKGSKVIFYTSKKLLGEGTVERVERMEPSIAWNRYKSQIFLNDDQYKEYVVTSPVSGEHRKMTFITIFFLENLEKYRDPQSSAYNITPAGRYISREEYQRIRAKLSPETRYT